MEHDVTETILLELQIVISRRKSVSNKQLQRQTQLRSNLHTVLIIGIF